ncbi:MAG TPA: hypothetical protein VGG06_30425 [Thermoanaerobaculia bacterium]|jgi:hypothetical protein
MEHDPVSITITLDYSQEPAGISVEPEIATIHRHSAPNRVSWKAVNIAFGDEIVISSKSYLSDHVRGVFGGRSDFTLTHAAATIVTDEPSTSALSALQALARVPDQKIYWIYDVILRRAGETIGSCDPIVLIDKDP